MNRERLTCGNWADELGKLARSLILDRGQILLCVMGRTGTGKSTLGKRIRKHGLAGVPARRIAVIDDSVLSVSLLGLVTFRIRRPLRERDELAAFSAYLRKKDLIVYVNSNPLARISHCDILLNLFCDDGIRRQRLLVRNADGQSRFDKSVVKGDPPLPPADYIFELDVSVS